jgi:hypothetical protein
MLFQVPLFPHCATRRQRYALSEKQYQKPEAGTNAGTGQAAFRP